MLIYFDNLSTLRCGDTKRYDTKSLKIEGIFANTKKTGIINFVIDPYRNYFPLFSSVLVLILRPIVRKFGRLEYPKSENVGVLKGQVRL